MITAILNEHSSEAQTNWGANDPTEGCLEVGKAYEVSEIEVHSFHTKIHLKDFPGKKFNSVVFTIEPISAKETAVNLWRQERGLKP